MTKENNILSYGIIIETIEDSNIHDFTKDIQIKKDKGLKKGFLNWS